MLFCLFCFVFVFVFFFFVAKTDGQLNSECLACSKPSVDGAVRRASGERGKNEGVWEGRTRNH